jgi:prevent-host-death family protein
MVQPSEIFSLSDFQRHTKAHIRRLKRTGRPQVLTVNGRAEVVVQDARAYQKLLALLDDVGAVEGIRRGLRSLARGEGVTLKEFDTGMRRKYRIPRRP